MNVVSAVQEFESDMCKLYSPAGKPDISDKEDVKPDGDVQLKTNGATPLLGVILILPFDPSKQEILKPLCSEST